MTTYRLDKATIALGAGAMLSALLVLVDFRSDTISQLPPRFSSPAALTTTAVIALLVVGAVAVVGGLLGGGVGRILGGLAGLLFAGIALLLLAQNAGDFSFFDATRASMALFGGFAVGLLAVALTPREEE